MSKIKPIKLENEDQAAFWFSQYGTCSFVLRNGKLYAVCPYEHEVRFGSKQRTTEEVVVEGK